MKIFCASALTDLQHRDCERSRLIALKWATISREKAKEDFSIQNAAHRTVPIGAP
jgi:hypothetical protein